MVGLFDSSGSLRDWVPLHGYEIENEIQRIHSIHQSKDMKNILTQRELERRRALSKMTSPLMISKNQNINMLRRVGPSNIRPGQKIGAAFFHYDNLLAMPLKRQNVLNFPYVHRRPRAGPIKVNAFKQ